MCRPFVHNIDPVLGELAGFYLWFYGLSYALGFLSILFWFRRVRHRLGLSAEDALALTVYLAIGVLLGGRLVEVIFYEWAYYQDHLLQIPAVWLGGMSTHGVLLGVIVAAWIFCRSRGANLLAISDQLVIPGSYLMGMGRIGNFIDGQILGSVTNVCWAVQFPDAEGFRHPVVLYDGAKNFFVLALLLLLASRKPARGILAAHFIFWYGFLRIFVDLFREYPTTLLGLATGQAFNLTMSVVGAFLIFWFARRARTAQASEVSLPAVVSAWSPRIFRFWPKAIALAALLLISLTLPSDWTQDIPGRYGKRHEGLRYSRLYPRIEGNIPLGQK